MTGPPTPRRPRDADRLEAQLTVLRKPPLVYAVNGRQPGPTVILKRGELDKPGDPVAPGSPAVVQGPPAADLPDDAAGRRAPPGVRRLGRAPGQPARLARDRQPRVAAPLRRRAGPHAERLRAQRRPADAPGVARLAGDVVPRLGWPPQAAAPADRHVGDVPPGGARSTRRRRPWTRTTGCSGGSPRGGWRRRPSATPCSPPPASSTARPAGRASGRSASRRSTRRFTSRSTPTGRTSTGGRCTE